MTVSPGWSLRSARTPRRPAARGDVFVERALAAEDVVVVLGEAVGFVADLLEQAQGRIVAGQADGAAAGLDVELLLALGQRYDHGRR
jgi:hypothetical protein